MMTPDMIADTWLGAIAWELGSQTCNGMIPAFRPNPTSAKAKIIVARAEQTKCNDDGLELLYPDIETHHAVIERLKAARV